MGTSATLHFHTKNAALFTNYDGYESGIAHALYKAFDLFTMREVSHEIAREPLINRIIATHMDTMQISAFELARDASEYIYTINEDSGEIYATHDERGNVVLNQRISTFINTTLLSEARFCRHRLLMAEDDRTRRYEAGRLKEYAEFFSTYEPCIQLLGRDTGCRNSRHNLFMTADRARKLMAAIEDHADKGGYHAEDERLWATKLAEAIDSVDNIEYEIRVIGDTMLADIEEILKD